MVVVLAAYARADIPGLDALTRGIQAFEAGQYKQAEALFDNALTRGGLSRAATLTAYVDLGVTLVVLGKADGAERAFEQAALIDPKFVVPPHSGPRAAKIADQARKKQEAIGAYHFDVGAPGDVKPGETFKVTTEMAEEQAGLVSLVRVAATEPGGKTFDTVEAAAAHVVVEVPGDVAQSGATIALRLELLDSHDNRLAIVEKTVKVGDGPMPPTKPDQGDKDKGDKDKGDKDKGDKDKGDKGDKDKGDKGEGDEGDEGAAEEGPWSIPHGSKKYTAVRAERAPVIDGVLDDPVWKLAPEDDRFLSTKSKPYGKIGKQPTSIQIAFDDKNLYVGVHCRYSKPRPPNDEYAGDETSLLAESENISVLVDAVHGHTGAYQFAVSPAGVRADAELSDQGSAQNLDWHGIWDVATAFTADGWTAEFSIPWGTMYMPSHDDAFDIGINFARHEPLTGDTLLWALHPPATELYDVNFFGHVDGLSRVHPGQRLLLLPYGAAAFDTTATPQSQLTDLTGSGIQARLYAGIYMRLRPPGPFRLDATFNPDFSAVNPDAALANFDRFEIEYPEARPFFAEDNARFTFGGTRYFFGDPGAQLFYSRQLGLVTNAEGLTQIVPILWGVKSVFRDGGTEAALMNVETVQPKPGVILSDNATVGRVTESFAGQRIGAIILGRAGDSGGYGSAGVDGQFSAFDRHLQLTGFYAGSQGSTTTGGPSATSAAGEGTVGWKSQDVYVKGTLLDIGDSFVAPLGYFPQTGIRAETIAGGYTPVVRSDLVQQVYLEGQMSIVRERDDDTLVYRRSVVAASLQTIEGSLVSVQVQPASENVITAFPIGSRIMVQPGLYHPLGTQFDLTCPPNRTFVYGIHYSGGDLYSGTRRAPGGMVGLNLGRLTTRLNYIFYLLKFPGQDFYGHDFSLSASFAYSPLARSTLVLEADTVASRGTALLTTSYQFGALSALTLTIRGTSGSTIAMEVTDTFANPGLTAILSLAIGVSPI